MFGWFKRKEQKEEKPSMSEEILITANNIACDFADFVAERVKPGVIYDVSFLPFPKDAIRNSVKVWLYYGPKDPTLYGWEIILPALAQFQDGVGDVPFGLNFSEEDLSGKTPEEVTNMIRNQKMPTKELSDKVMTERLELALMVKKILTSKFSK